MPEHKTDFGAQYCSARQKLINIFLETPRQASAFIAAMCDISDTAVRAAWQQAGAPQGVSIIATGGYGRGSLAPHSDLDLLFLTDGSASPEQEAAISDTLYALWDLKLKIGHATRSIDDCIIIAREDMTVRTALLEMRPLVDGDGLFVPLQVRLTKEIHTGTAAQFITAKLDERSIRHRKQGGQRYVVEPNVKEGKGGLRDLHTLFWIAKYVHQAQSRADLLPLGMFSADEFDTFSEAEDFLWAVRCHMHLIIGRSGEKLSFDIQVAVAECMGYEDCQGRRAVEYFMQEYFRNATAVGELTRIFLTSLETMHVKAKPERFKTVKRAPKLPAPYDLKSNRLTVADEVAFLADPLNMLRIFDHALRSGTLLHPEAMRLVAANLDLLDDDLRNNREANRIFLGLMTKRGNPERALRRMNELGVLGKFVPEFARIVAMMQFNMYHHYTVDEHTIQTIATLHQIEEGELENELPNATAAMRSGINRKVIFVALLLHDIGKGRPEDHSVLGAQIARKLAPRFGLKPREAELVEWLVRYHLLMSDVAQKRDLSDPRTLRDFAKAVRSRERLDLLAVLTVCDIRGVGPGTWNNWKAQLLSQLYTATCDVLENGMEDLNRETREAEAKKTLKAALHDWPNKARRNELQRHYGPYWQSLPSEAHVVFAQLLRDIGDAPMALDLMPDPARDATRMIFIGADHPGLFARLSGAIALAGASVVDARIFTSRDGYMTSAIWLQDQDGHPFDAGQLPKLRAKIEDTLQGKIVARDALEPRDKIRKRERAFRVTTNISIDNEGSDIYTIIEIETRDRPGLLHDLCRILAAENLSIFSAVIATYGELVVDVFYAKTTFGLKLHELDKQKHLEAKLHEAIQIGARRARQ